MKLLLMFSLLASFSAQAASTVVLDTNYGAIEVELNEEKAPLTSKNFISYVKKGFYDGTIFHRVIDGFMIQGGGMTPDMKEKKTDAPIKNEAQNGLKNDKGTIAMARTSDPHSASSQFFINVSDNDFLNHTSVSSAGWGYAVFGKVTKGMDVVNKIKSVKTGNKNGHSNVPLDPVIIKSAKIK